MNEKQLIKKYIENKYISKEEWEHLLDWIEIIEYLKK